MNMQEVDAAFDRAAALQKMSRDLSTMAAQIEALSSVLLEEAERVIDRIAS